MKRWQVPITIVEYGRHVIVEAATRSDARRKARAAEWDECSDTEHYMVRIAGAAQEVARETKETKNKAGA